MGESSRVFIPVDFVEQYQSPSAHGLITTYFAVALVESLPTDLPLTPNLRRPNRRTEIFKQILNTLLVAPERFAERNNGIKITARGVEIGELDSQKGIWVDLGDDRATGGVVNGGHTLAAIAAAKIEGAPLEAARVKVEILCGLGDVEVGVTSLAVNTAAPVDTRSKLNALGRFEPLKALVKQIEAETGERWKVSWYQNQEGVNKSPHCSATHANLAGANLVEADLVEANLVGANLAGTIALGTNFNGATLTGACLEDCQLDRETNLDNVICDYVYLKKNQLERRPETGNFTPGEFAKLFQFQ